jgi:hypothetical protein
MGPGTLNLWCASPKPRWPSPGQPGPPSTGSSKALEAEGFIRLGYREIEVADPRALERIAEG